MSYRTLVRIKRYNPEEESNPYFQEYEVEYPEAISILEAVRYIYEEKDPTLSFRDFKCNKGICNSCLMVIDGKKKRSCQSFLEGQEKVTLEPLPDQPLVRDLVVDFNRTSSPPF